MARLKKETGGRGGSAWYQVRVLHLDPYSRIPTILGVSHGGWGTKPMWVGHWQGGLSYRGKDWRLL